MRPVSAAFTAALLLFLPAALVNTLVPAPEKVVVSCKNNRIVVQWDYPYHQPSTVFNIHLRSSRRSDEANTTDAHEFDLTEMVWASEEYYMDYNYVNVKAITGSMRSKPAQSNSFSFNQFKTVDINCKLEFLPVNLTVDDSGAFVSFQNPLHFYKELRRLKSPLFHVTIQSENRHMVKKQCEMEEKTCKFSIDLPPDTEPCVNITGIINEGLGQIQFKKTGPVCATASTGVYWLVVGLMLVIVAVVVAALTVTIYKLKAWTMKPSHIPSALAAQTQTQRHPTPPCDPTLSAIFITGSRPPLLAPGEELSPGEDSSDRPLNMEEEAEALIPAPRPHKDQDTDHYLDLDQDSAESTKTESLSLSSGSEVEMCLYETRPQLVTVEMGEGDTVIGYTGS